MCHLTENGTHSKTCQATSVFLAPPTFPAALRNLRLRPAGVESLADCGAVARCHQRGQPSQLNCDAPEHELSVTVM
jgi:hypothetical protein